ncbi:MAG: hypothetical protein JWN78_2037 [Bacteroidota bacterium]|nr:hypothetical protein [Bacteroidota bacterium]
MENYIQTLQANSEFARSEFSSLTDEQFNFKPSPDKWSIAQCLLHLVKTNKGYFPIYERLSTGNYTPNLFERMGLGKSLWEKLFINGVDPKNVKKMKAPPSIQPGKSHIDKSIIEKLAEQNKKVAEYYLQLQHTDLKNITISSPFANIIVYSADCAFNIVNLHEQRHLQQAKRVKDLL